MNKFTVLPKNYKKVIRDYSSFDAKKLCDDVGTIKWEFPNSNNASELFDTFYLKLTQVIDLHIPLKTLSKRKIKQTSVNHGLQVALYLVQIE